MKFKLRLIKYAFPLLLLTDYNSELFENNMILNISRTLRIFMLFIFIIDTIKYHKIIKHFNFYFGFFGANDAIYLMSILPYLQSQIEKNEQGFNRKQSFKS